MKFYLSFILLFTSSQLIAKPIDILIANIASVLSKDGIQKIDPKNLKDYELGREARILRQVFKCMGKEIKFTAAPFGRHLIWFEKSKQFDAVATVHPLANIKAHKSLSHIYYRNGVTSLVTTKPIQRLEDLHGLRVISFVGATKFLKELGSHIQKFKSYQEIADQEIHSKMLYNERVDAVISDGIIFASHTKDLRRKFPKNENYKKQVSFNQLFEDLNFFLYFKEKSIRDSFNKCLSSDIIKKKIQNIENNYIFEQLINY